MVRWADYGEVEEAVSSYVRWLNEHVSSLEKVFWYGSWPAGTATPRSDVDLCVVVSQDSRPPRERVAALLPSRFPTGVDLSVLTSDEFNELSARSPSWHRAITSGRLLHQAS